MLSQGAGPQIWVGDEKPTLEKLNPVTNSWEPNMPAGGFWTCPMRENGTSAWVTWMRENRFVPYEDPKLWKLIPRDDVSLYRVDTAHDAGIFVPGGTEGYGPLDDPRLEFEAVFELCDGVHMTKTGLNSMSVLTTPNLSGWDCETIVWGGWHFVGEPEYLGEPDLSEPV